jgi:hypothetical protein
MSPSKEIRVPQNQLASQWSDPPAIFRGAPFWAWNADLDPQRLSAQIEQMHRAGMGGFFMHSRYGLHTPYLSEKWFECVSACIEKARQLGMKAYLYDEDRWPSGAAGGMIGRSHPEFRPHYLDAELSPRQSGAQLGPGWRIAFENQGQPLAAFALRTGADGKVAGYRRIGLDDSPASGESKAMFVVRRAAPTAWYNDSTYIDTMNPDAVAEFIRITHDAYAARYGSDFGGVIPAIFTDEPESGRSWAVENGAVQRLPWTPALPREFKRRCGYDLLEHLPELACWLAAGDFSKVRHDYHRTACELFVEAFSEPYGRWCREHNIAFTGHYMSEQTLGSQIDCVGATMPHYEHQQWPGIDILCDKADELATAKQCASVADQLGRERVLSELYGCTGWDWPLEGHKFIGDWQFAAGVNFRCQHLTWYSAAGGAKRDYPASIAWHSPWWPYYRVVEDYFGRLSLALTQGTPVRDVLVIHPVESGWGLFTTNRPDGSALLHDLQDRLRELIYGLSGDHYDWDFGDESLMARHAKPRGAALKLGRMTYSLVIVPPCLTLRATTVKLLAKFAAGGGKVLFVGRQPSLVDGKPDSSLAQLLAAGTSCGASPAEFLPAVASLAPRRVSVAQAGRQATFIWTMLRQAPGGRLLFVQSHDRKAGHTVDVEVQGRGPVVLWDALGGGKRRLKADSADGRVRFSLALPPTGSALITLGMPAPGAAAAKAAPELRATRELAGPFEIELTEPNTLPLDYCQWRLGDEAFSPPVPTLKADTDIRARFGLASRMGHEAQPWYLYGTGAVDTAPRGRCQIKRTFHISRLPRKCMLAIERPGDFAVTVNGRPVPQPDGHWLCEPDIGTIDITALLREGDNELVQDFDYRPNMEIEDVYLVGDFGVAHRGDGPRRPGTPTLVDPPTSLRLGSWIGQGLDFYTGAIRYKLTVDKPSRGRRCRISLAGVACTAAVVHAGGRSFVLPWAPFEADITEALADGPNAVVIEVIGGRKNTLGPLHVPWEAWTGPAQFDPRNAKWTDDYLLVDHGLMSPVLIEHLS